MDRYNYKTDNLSGLDMHWYAVDQDGFIAEFWTCGNLPIPGLISHNDLRRIEYYADILFNQEDLVKKPCGSRTKLDFYGYDENRDGTTWQYPYAQVERPEHPMKVDELPEEIRQSIKIHLPISFTSKENIPLSVIPDPIDDGNPFVETGETPEEKRREAEEGTRLWKELQNRFDLGFEKRSEVYVFVRNEFDTKDFRALFCPECYEKHSLIYPWKCIEVPEKHMILKGSTYVETIGDYVYRCKYCDVDYHKPIVWQFSGDSPLTEPPDGTCDVEIIDRIPDTKPTSFISSPIKWLFD